MARVPGTSLRSAISIGQTLRQVIATGKITRSDELAFLQALSSHTSLTDDDIAMMNDLMRRMDRGWIKVVDE